MIRTSSFRALSWACVLGLVAFYVWVSVVPFGYAGAPIAVAVMLGLVLATLKLGAGKPIDYWEAVAEPDQVSRITLLILLALTVQLSLGAALRIVDQLNWVWSNAIYHLVWTGMPVVFVALRIIRWPRRCASPPIREFLTVAATALMFGTVMCWIGTLTYDGPREAPSPADLVIGVAAMLLGATMEEVVFRVLLLTALVQASGSRSQALILSSVLFALFHVPPALSGFVVDGEWAQLSAYAGTLLPQMVFIIGLGFFFGALWLRTGSIILISIVHAMCNLGQVLVGGLNGL